ncbi:MAG: ferredoxin [Chloroflexi bacterium]|nr:ferredoxin [Chloroflexota bacterium]
MRVRIDRKLCDGLANCVGVAPSVFQLDAEHKAIVLDVSSVDEDTLWRAAESCTRSAVILEDDEGNQLYP